MYAYQPPPPFPLGAFPAIIRDAIIELQQHVETSPELIGLSMLSGLAATIQGCCKVVLPFGSITHCSLYTLILADSGERKSTVDKLVCQPLLEHDEALEGAYREQSSNYLFDHEMWKLQRQELVKQIAKMQRKGGDTRQLREKLSAFQHTEPNKPRQKRFILQDASEPAILDAINGEGQSIALMADEGGIVLNSPAFEKQGVMNKAWDGGPIKFTRAYREVSAKDVRLTLSLMVQVDVFQEFLRRRKSVIRGSGFLARFLMCFPPSTQGFRNSTNIERSWPKLALVHQRMREILATTENQNASKDTILEFDEDAKAAWFEFVNAVEVNIQYGQPFSDIRDYASKSGEMVARIAGIFHIFTGQTGKINCDTLNRAIDIVSFHAYEYQSILSSNLLQPTGERDMFSLLQYLVRLSQESFSPLLEKNFVRKRSGLRKPGQFDWALAEVQARGFVTIWIDPKSKKQTIRLESSAFAFPCLP